MIAALLRQKRREREQVQTIERLSSELLDALVEKNKLERRIEEIEQHPLSVIYAAGKRPSLETVVAGIEEAGCFAERLFYEDTPSANQLVIYSPFRGAESFRTVLEKWQNVLTKIGFELCGFGPASGSHWEIRALWRGKE